MKNGKVRGLPRVVLQWMESSAEENALTRAIEHGTRQALLDALKSGKAQVEDPGILASL
jgi:hypothetical protein